MIVMFYSKEGCHLCDEVMVILDDFPCTVNIINIDHDEETFAKYHYSIPVLIIGDVTLQAPITRGQIRAAFAT